MKYVDSWIIYKSSPSQVYLSIHDVLFNIDDVNKLCSSKGFFSYCSKAYRIKYENKRT